MRVWVLSQTARYLPTGIAGFAARVVMAAKEGVPRTLTSATLAIESALLAVWAGLFAGVFIPSSVVATPWRILLGAGSAIAIAALPALLALGGRLFPRASCARTSSPGPQTDARGDPRLRRERGVEVGPLGDDRGRRAAVHGSDIPLLIGAEALGVLAGLVGITPAGIGVREAVIAGALRDRFGFADAFALAVIVRVDFVVELIWIGIALVLRRNAVHVRRPRSCGTGQ